VVFFGPFIGEFGWELAHWQWWVRRACLEKFRGYRKIACSFPGRVPLYPYVDEFWPLPESFLQLRFTPLNYVTNGWRNGWPGRYTVHHPWIYVPPRWRPAFRRLPGAARRVLRRLREREVHIPTPDVEPRALALLDEFKQRLPENTLFFVPWQMNLYGSNGLRFGMEVAQEPLNMWDFHPHPIPFAEQHIEPIRPTPRGEEALRALAPDQRPVIAVFPRYIPTRRSDRNWPKARYIRLINELQRRFPQAAVGVFGEPGGAYFVNDPPPGCLDLINVPSDLRLDLQLAALQRSLFALGSGSGGVSMALATGCPALCWGYQEFGQSYHIDANPLGTLLLYYPTVHPSVAEVVRLAEGVSLTVQHRAHRLPQ
jgi:hypothetical protein